MSIETTTFVWIAHADWEANFAVLADQAHRCLLRNDKALPGDRTEDARYDTLSRQIERLAFDRILSGAPSVTMDEKIVAALDESLPARRHAWWLALQGVPESLQIDFAILPQQADGGGTIIEIRDPFGHGAPHPPGEAVRAQPIEPAAPWRAPGGERGLRAVAVRWEAQLASAAAGGTEPLVPSSVSNRVLTEGLRDYVVRRPGHDPSRVRVVYRDGSEAQPFPIHALDLSGEFPDDAPALRLALLSMRHPEMDVDIDGAWLRNRDISQIRPAAETDAIVYQITTRQLRQLLGSAPLRLYLYQTGLEPAIVGFYRALAEHLIEFPGSLRVLPQYFNTRSSDFEEGTPW